MNEGQMPATLPPSRETAGLDRLAGTWRFTRGAEGHTHRLGRREGVAGVLPGHLRRLRLGARRRLGLPGSRRLPLHLHRDHVTVTI